MKRYSPVNTPLLVPGQPTSVDDDATLEEGGKTSDPSCRTPDNGAEYRSRVSLVFNFVAAICIILGNKVVLSTSVGFRFPLALTTIGNIGTVIGVTALRYKPGHCTWQPQTKTHFMQLGALGVSVGLQNGLSNLSLALNSVSSFQLAKLLSCPIVALLEWRWLGRALSRRRVLLLVVITVAVGIAQKQDFAFTVTGCSVAMMWCAPAAFNKCAYAKVQQQGSKADPLGLLFYVAPSGVLTTAFLSLLLDPPGLGKWLLEARAQILLFVVCQTLLLGFLLQWSSAMAIGATSALTHSVLGELKSCFIMLAGVALFGDMSTMAGAAASVVAICAMALYAYYGTLENRQQATED